MAATSILKQWELLPNSALKTIYIQVPNTCDENDTVDVTLADYGISATGLLTIRSWVHTTDGSIIVTDIATCSVTAGVCTVTLQSANDNCGRVIELIGRADAGVFAYVLPFLMIFAIVYGILSKTHALGSNRGVDATVSLSVGLLALNSGYVTNFFAFIFPYTGMAIAVILVALILTGFVGENISWVKYIWFGVGALSFLLVMVYSFSDWSWYGFGGYGLAQSMPAIIAIGLLLIVMGFIIWGGNR